VAGTDRRSGDSGLRVFLSYTSELRNFPEQRSYVAEAEQAISAAGHIIADMADFPSADQPSAELCAERVRGCDVYVGLLGTRYGSPVRDKPEVSYTELEFDTATAAGLARLMFLLDTASPDVGIPLAQLIDMNFGAQQENFRRRVQESVVTQSFSNPSQLGRLVEHSLRELHKERRRAGPLPSGSVLRVWNIPARNPGFTGREEVLAAVRERLLASDRTAVQVLQGMGGVGKTQLANEYAHRFAEGYDVAWWVNAEQAALIGDQFVGLGAALGSVQSGASTEAARSAVLATLRERGRWLLVFDNAENPADVTRWLPGGGGHVLITSRERGWAETAVPVEVDMLRRAESVAILRDRVAGLGESDADQLAAELGDLPLALVQAGSYMRETGMPAAQCLDLLRTQAGELLDQVAPGSAYPRSLAAATRLIADRLDQDDPAAAQLAYLCAFMAPEPIPEDLFTRAAAELPGELAARAADPLAWRQTLGHLARQSLARIDQHGLQLHRLTQAILRDSLAPEQAAATREQGEALLVASDPGSPADVVTWPRWAQLMPHLLAADLADTSNPRLRWMACHACCYLLARGDDTRMGGDLARDLRRRWRERLGDDDQNALTATAYLARSLWNTSRYTEARDLDLDILARRRRVLGDDHPSTVSSAHNLASDLRELGDVQAARDLDQDSLDRRRRMLGDDHPDTLQSANSLASDLRLLGDVSAARDLDQDTLDRKRRVLGWEHPSTMISVGNLAIDLRLSGDVQAARELDQDTLDRKRRVLGEDHPSTLTSAGNLAIDLRFLGEVQAARDLDQFVLAGRRRVLGEDHPHTLQSARNLAEDLRLLGEAGAAS
jgi:hypothetical protein